MIVEFNKKFIRELKKINDKRILKKIELFIVQLESEENLLKFNNIKSLIGHKTFFRYKIDVWRIGFTLISGKIEIKTIQHRKEIYKNFP
ncbi:MAG: type II toxin-antitoxin system RelE/ParE family toxin [Bacteroidota bacterium]